jgi:hypothetical protein
VIKTDHIGKIVSQVFQMVVQIEVQVFARKNFKSGFPADFLPPQWG